MENEDSSSDLFTGAPDDLAPELPHDLYVEGEDGVLHYAGSMKLPEALPTELHVEYKGWNYVFKLQDRYKEDPHASS